MRTCASLMSRRSAAASIPIAHAPPFLPVTSWRSIQASWLVISSRWARNADELHGLGGLACAHAAVMAHRPYPHLSRHASGLSLADLLGINICHAPNDDL